MHFDVQYVYDICIVAQGLGDVRGSSLRFLLMGDLSSTPTSEFDKVDMETLCASLSTIVFLPVWNTKTPWICLQTLLHVIHTPRICHLLHNLILNHKSITIHCSACERRRSRICSLLDLAQSQLSGSFRSRNELLHVTEARIRNGQKSLEARIAHP